MSTQVELQAWLTGTVDGGPNADGRYPLTYADGLTYLVYCPAAQALNPALSEQPIEVFANTATAAAATATVEAAEAEQSSIDAQTYAANAAASATAANTAKVAAQTAKTAAELAETNAELAETNAESAATAAATSAGNAAASETAADASADAAAASAADAAASAAGKADDSAVVHNTGVETIAGAKTFSSMVQFSSPSAVKATFGTGGDSTQIVLDSDAASAADILLKDAGVIRWILRKRGSGASADFQLLRRPDGGADTAVLTVNRATGVADFSVAPTINGVGLMKQAWNLIAGNGLTGGGDGSADRTITLGTPGTITGSTTNSVTATSHTHALTTYALTFGNGLVSGSFNGSNAAATVTLGTPGTLDENTTNAVTAASHTHNVLLSYLYNTDNRTTPLRVDPADYTDRGLSTGFNSGANLGIASTYGMSLHLATWTVYNAAYRQHQLNFAGDGSGIYWRFATSDTTWGTTYKVLTTADAVDAATLGGMSPSGSDDPSTIANRNGSGDIYARLFRSTYPDETAMSGAITFRKNNTTDNYDRHCNSPAAVKGWLSLDSRDVPMKSATANSTGTVAATLVNTIIEKSNTTAYTHTITTSTTASPGDAITWVNSGTAGNVTIAAGTSVTIVRNGVTGNVTVAPGSVVTLVRSATANKWVG